MVRPLPPRSLASHILQSGSRALYQTLFPSTPPSAPPPNWTRSRIRRQHLITLGVPVNIDEFLPRVSGKQMPALQISTRPMSAPPGPRHLPLNNGAASTNNSRNNSRAVTPVSTTPSRTGPSVASQLGLGPKPQLDEKKITELLELTPGSSPFSTSKKNHHSKRGQITCLCCLSLH